MVIDLIKQKFGVVDNINILDVGSGQGDLLSKIAKAYPTASLLGFELSKSGVEISQKKLPKASFFEVDLFSPTTEIIKFSSWATVVCCSEVLEHTDNPGLFLKNIFPFINSGGMIIVTVPSGPMTDFDRFIGHRQHFTKEELRKLLLSAGYNTPSIYLAGFPFHNLFRLILILRGNKLIKDVDTSYSGGAKYLANLMMSLFKILFLFNFNNTAWGWQLLGLAYK